MTEDSVYESRRLKCLRRLVIANLDGIRAWLRVTTGMANIILRSASLADGIPVSLRDTVTGPDHGSTARLLTAIRHAS